MRKIAVNHAFVQGKYLCPAVIILSDNSVIGFHKLVGEEADTEWVGGSIVIENVEEKCIIDRCHIL